MEVVGVGTDIVECLRVGRMIDQHGELALSRVYAEAQQVRRGLRADRHQRQLRQGAFGVPDPAAAAALTRLAAGGSGGLPGPVMTLAKGVVIGMFVRKLEVVALAALGLAAAGAGGPSRKPAEPPPAREALERFRQMTPEDRLRHAEKAGAAAALFAPVARGDLAAAVVERGTLESAEVSDVVCRVKGGGEGRPATTIIRWLIDDGTLVQKGQKLVELDDSTLREELSQRSVAFDKAKADRAAAETDLEVVRKENQLASRTAELSLKVARREMKKYTGADAEEKEILALKVEQAALALDLAKLRARGREARAGAELSAKALLMDQEAKRKRAAEEQLEACVLTAPRDGLAVYYVPEVGRFGIRPPVVAVGEPIREGQKLLRVCKLDRFVLGTRLPEDQVSRVRAGQAASVRVDAFPNRTFRARVKEVSPVASQADWLRADVKVYPAVLELLDHVPGLKPGMTAEARIEQERRPKVLLVPTTSVLRSGRETFCFVKIGQELQERRVTTGGRNDLQVEVKEGLKEAELVLSTPGAVLGPPARR